MYVTTFYSFKGGVGRTFALVNVGVELARTGRKVLLVDFDLEAPGIHTFHALSPEKPHPGVVECVTDYTATRSSPDVREYVYEKGDVAREGGRLWIMPAGRGEHEYRRRLASISWPTLYGELDGYLFFEDVKAQWKEAFDPDYVLIDSRTGHTDVEGICTRQLPDAVVMLFFPNQQNLCGLREVVRDIKAESERTRRNEAAVTLHFVMSNVPDLDDEDGILRDRIREFRGALGYETLSTIHSYPSLALLNQTIFTQERTRSRLAREYRRLKDQIVDHNNEDPEGVVRFLKDLETPRFLFSRRKMADIDTRVQSIQEKHASNAEVMFLLGVVKKSQVSLVEATALFDRAMDLGYQESAALLERATCRFLLNDRSGASQDIERLLQASGAGGYELYRAVQLMGMVEKRLLNLVPGSAAFQSLDADEKYLIARSLFAQDALAASADVFRVVMADPKTSKELQGGARNQLTLALIALSRWAEAMNVIGSTRPCADQLEIQDAFNYAIAEWAQTGNIPRDSFARVIELDGIAKRSDASYEQCLAVAFWAVGNVEEAQNRLAKAEERAQQIKRTEFSCWRYREVARDEFLEDCRAVRDLILKGEGRPAFFLAK